MALLGYLYVLEGSTLGAAVLRQTISRAYQVTPDAGMAYYGVYGNQVRFHWADFKQRMESAVVSSRDQDLVVQAARDGFRHVGAILAALSGDLPSYDRHRTMTPPAPRSADEERPTLVT